MSKADRRAQRERELGAKVRALPRERFGIVYCDNPWRFEPYSRATGMDRSAENHYPCMLLDDIMALGVPRIAAPDSACFMWATSPMMVEALNVLAAWGFRYVSQMVWTKDRIGTGYWFRSQHEILLVGTRGRFVAPAMGTQLPSVLNAPVGRHSKKPDAVAEWIERTWPSLPKIELFRRGAAREGFHWRAWGNEAG